MRLLGWVPRILKDDPTTNNNNAVTRQSATVSRTPNMIQRDENQHHSNHYNRHLSDSDSLLPFPPSPSSDTASVAFESSSSMLNLNNNNNIDDAESLSSLQGLASSRCSPPSSPKLSSSKSMSIFTTSYSNIDSNLNFLNTNTNTTYSTTSSIFDDCHSALSTKPTYFSSANSNFDIQTHSSVLPIPSQSILERASSSANNNNNNSLRRNSVRTLDTGTVDSIITLKSRRF